MFLRCKVRRKDGKQHRYWSVVEDTRVAGGRVVQRHVLYRPEWLHQVRRLPNVSSPRSPFTVLPLVGALLAGNPNSFRLMALPGGLAIFVVPPLLYFVLPESPRWHLRRGRVEAAVDLTNRIIRRAGSRVPPLSAADLGDLAPAAARERLPPYWALFRRGQLRWTAIGISSYVSQSIAFFLTSTLLPKALVDQGAAVAMSFGVASLVFGASIPGKAFTGYLMEIIGRRWTICYALLGSLPGLCLMLLAHRTGGFAGPVMMAGALITGFTALSAGTAARIYLSEQFPTALRGRATCSANRSAACFPACWRHS